MKFLPLMFLISTGLILPGSVFGNVLSHQTEDTESRYHLSMDLDWKFTTGDPQNAHQPEFNDSGWRQLDLPHDWSIEGEYDEDAAVGGDGGYLPTGIGWYRKTFSIPEELLNKKIQIQFDGVYENSTVWINGEKLGHRPFGYISFKYNLTEYLQEGENVIAVRVDNSNQPNTRWYSGSGIYRHVWLTIKNPVHIAQWGVYVTTPVAEQDYGVVEVETTINNRTNNMETGELISVLMDPDGNEVARNNTKFSAAADTITVLNTHFQISNPNRWSVQNPALYKLNSIIQKEGMETDRLSTNVGIRKIEYKLNDGFFLNGEKVKMNGVNLHHDGGAVGAAVPIGVWERRFKKLKEMGVNAIRTAHNPMAPEFLDLADKMGFLVMNEVFDEWTHGKREHTYHQYFDEWYERDLRSFILRDRNHPSIVMWSAGNEIGEQRSAGDGLDILRNLMEIFREMDPTRPVTTGNDYVGETVNPPAIPFYDELDIVGYNYADRWHERRVLYFTPDKIEHPNWKVIGSESSSISGPRGYYPLGDDPNRINPGYNTIMINPAEQWKYISAHDFVFGDFMWTGIDYLGEAGWPHKNNGFGVIDLAGFDKDAFYFYQSQWTDEPVLHLFPHWNLPEERMGQILPVIAYTNVDVVELYLNDKFYGEKRVEFPRQGTSCGWNCYEDTLVHPTTADLHLSWDVPFEPGTLKAVGKNREGEVIITKEIVTTGAPYSIRLSADNSQISANGRDVSHIKVEIVDREGHVVPTADNLVQFSIEGAGEIIGVDNGNPTDHDPHKADFRNAFHGLALAIVQSTREEGVVRLRAESEGLEGAFIEINITQDDTPKFYYEQVYGQY